jgi:hypothetical protein
LVAEIVENRDPKDVAKIARKYKDNQTFTYDDIKRRVDQRCEYDSLTLLALREAFEKQDKAKAREIFYNSFTRNSSLEVDFDELWEKGQVLCERC